MRPCGSPTALECCTAARGKTTLPPPHKPTTAAQLSRSPLPMPQLQPCPAQHAGALMRIVGRQTSTTCAAGRSQFSPRRCTYNNCPLGVAGAGWDGDGGVLVEATHIERRHSVRNAGSLKWHISHIVPSNNGKNNNNSSYHLCTLHQD